MRSSTRQGQWEMKQASGPSKKGSDMPTLDYKWHCCYFLCKPSPGYKEGREGWQRGHGSGHRLLIAVPSVSLLVLTPQAWIMGEAGPTCLLVDWLVETHLLVSPGGCLSRGDPTCLSCAQGPAGRVKSMEALSPRHWQARFCP